MVHDQKTGKPRGYAFIEYEHEKDMHSKYKPIENFDLNFSSGDQLNRTFTVILFYLRISWLQHCLWAMAILGDTFSILSIEAITKQQGPVDSITSAIPFFFKMTKQKCDWLLSFLFTKKHMLNLKTKVLNADLIVFFSFVTGSEV